jgi:cytoskeletal protein CcmA (bactofilin family)
MFNNNNNNGKDIPVNKPVSTPGSSALNMISVGTSIEGEITSDGDFRIDGKVKGTVTSKAKLAIGSTGVVDGDLICENADVSGKIFGTIKVNDMLFLKSSGYIEGDIIATKLVVEAGATFNGSCSMGVKEMKHADNKPAAANTTTAQKKEAI